MPAGGCMLSYARYIQMVVHKLVLLLGSKRKAVHRGKGKNCMYQILFKESYIVNSTNSNSRKGSRAQNMSLCVFSTVLGVIICIL